MDTVAGKTRGRSLLKLTGVAALVTLAILVLDFSPAVSPIWYGPYLSAAKNIEWGGEFRINLEEVQHFVDLPREARESYAFKRTDDLQAYRANPIGFVYVIAAAKRLFFWQPDAQAVRSLQSLVHVAMCVSIVALLVSPTQRVLFLALYAVNPLVIYFVTNPIYFFWQAIPSFGLTLLMLMHGPNANPFFQRRVWNASFLCLSAALGLMLLVRPTMIGGILTFFLLSFAWLRDRRVWAIGAALFLGVTVSGYSPNDKNFWHSPYVGIGAYPNPYMEGLSDNNGYAMFERKTNIPFHASLGGPYYDDSIMDQYTRVTREEYLHILRDDWPLLLRNTALNLTAGFSFGYLVGKPHWVHYASSLGGLIFLGLLIYTRQLVLIALVAVTIAPFALYFPPIPAYMYGAYMLLVFGLIVACDRLGITARLDRRLKAAGPKCMDAGGSGAT